ncbi:isoamyl alcohol oxidase [Akanthomyces lecanii RCEF 1005]|uniref:Isoamyl alcohol oxidase n=1 Tax=Akanthomyces lecanii RCEF 1005 TaxID=1081108 RepID=A0A162MV67_CORDF|nr:isoamyl alcohol oxidase [Akanthomyces lecanii RCEF 1005]
MSFLILLLLPLAFAAEAVSSNSDPGYNCRPGQGCWPSIEEWTQFNSSVGGHVYKTVPLAAACYKSSPYYDENACHSIQELYGNSTRRGEFFGQTYWLNWETCHNTGCGLLESDPTESLHSSCSLGRLAAYYVDVREPSHISAALQFAKKHNIRISIKNTGHDFYGRSSVPNTLAIWTKNLATMRYHANFTAHDCRAADGPNVGELGAGVIAGDAYRYFARHGMDVTGGYEQSVGLAGGFAQGGGVGSFTTTYGLMADNAVEFEVVTADGRLRTVNQCNDPALFWAMRGGGGGTYAVLTKYRVQVYPSLPIHAFEFTANFTDAGPSRDGSKNRALREILHEHARSQPAWSAQLLTGQIEYFPERFSIKQVVPYGDDGAKLRSAMQPFYEYLNNRTDLQVIAKGYTSYANYAAYLSVTAADAKITEPSGIFSILASRLIPRSVFSKPETLEELVEGVAQGILDARKLVNRTGTQVVSETPLTNLDVDQSTSAHPAWRDALWHVIHVGEWDAPLPERRLQDVVGPGFLKLVEPLKKLSPGGGAYLNEANYLEPDWKQTFFGAFYDRLAAVKSKYDPTHLFDCYKCVGWRGENE